MPARKTVSVKYYQTGNCSQEMARSSQSPGGDGAVRVWPPAGPPRPRPLRPPQPAGRGWDRQLSGICETGYQFSRDNNSRLIRQDFRKENTKSRRGRPCAKPPSQEILTRRRNVGGKIPSWSQKNPENCNLSIKPPQNGENIRIFFPKYAQVRISTDAGGGLVVVWYPACCSN